MDSPLSPYLFLNGIALIVGLLLFDQALEKHQRTRRDAAYVLFVMALVAGWFGAHVLDWLIGTQSFGRAGFIFYGGLLSGCLFVATVGRCYLSSHELWGSLNTAVVPLLVSHGIGRIGCFLAGCCYGTTTAWGSRHPTQVYESAYLFLLALVLSRQDVPWFARRVYVYLTAYPAFRFILEMFRGDDRGRALGLSTSQWISLGFLGVAATCFIRLLPKKTSRVPWRRQITRGEPSITIGAGARNVPE